MEEKKEREVMEENSGGQSNKKIRKNNKNNKDNIQQRAVSRKGGTYNEERNRYGAGRL